MQRAAQPVWGQGFGLAAELPLGAELYVSADSTGNLVAGDRANSTVFAKNASSTQSAIPAGPSTFN